MSDQTDKRLHDWVRQSLASHQPPYAPADWVRLQRQRQRRRWWQKGLWISLGVILVGMLSWLWVYRRNAQKVTIVLAASKPAGGQPVPDTRTRVTLHLPVPKPAPSTIRFSRLRTDLPAHARPDRSVTRYLDQFIPTIPVQLTLQTSLTGQIHRKHPVAFSREEAAIVHQMQTGEFGSDSTTYQVLDRNIQQWSSSVIVCDMTTSMYPYTTQLFSWLRRKTTHTDPLGLVFFTDCDSMGRQTRPGGPPGQLYISRGFHSDNTLPLLLEAARNTVENKDDAENTVEALLRAQTEFPQARHLVLIADNLSQVKDMHLLNRLIKPVHVVLCGTTGSDTAIAYQPDYYQIAEQTHGSLHTLEDDVSLNAIPATQTLRVGTHFYRYSIRRKQFKLTPYDHRPRRFLGFIWL